MWIIDHMVLKVVREVETMDAGFEISVGHWSCSFGSLHHSTNGDVGDTELVIHIHLGNRVTARLHELHSLPLEFKSVGSLYFRYAY